MKVANNSGSDVGRLDVEARVYDLDGRQRYSKRAAIDSPADSVTKCFTIAFPRGLSSTHFVKLLLTQGTHAVSDNFYWRGETYRSYEALAGMPKAAVTGSARQTVNGATHTVTATVTNPTANVALMIRLLLTRATSGARVLPVYYADNYFSLLPGETKDVSLKFDEKYLGGEKPKLLIQGFNAPATELPVE